MTANRETILLMLYAGAIRFLKQGILATEENRIEDKSRFLLKTQDIVTELRSTLDFKVGGEIATTLERLYDYVTERLIKGNIESNTQSLKEALTVLETLNDAWEKAVEKVRQNVAQPEPQPENK